MKTLLTAAAAALLGLVVVMSCSGDDVGNTDGPRPPDAGPPDAPRPDAGPPDARPPDAGPPDARPPDAGPPDARPPDARPPIDAPRMIDARPAVDAAPCGTSGQSCSPTSPCCANLTCVLPTGGPCAVGAAGCTCR